MLYLAVCRSCNFLMEASDPKLIKELICDHAERSHKLEMPLFPADLPLKAYEELVNIMRIRKAKDIQMLKLVVKSPQFWDAFRKKSPSFSERAN